jgi:hypothetical protein
VLQTVFKIRDQNIQQILLCRVETAGMLPPIRTVIRGHFGYLL